MAIYSEETATYLWRNGKMVRWAEAKCLVGGTTTSQGIALYSNAGITKYYRGLVRNVEETNDPELPEASTRIGDVEAGSGAKFLARLESHRDKGKKLILHLAEGTDDRANDHFRALKIDDRRWAINEALVGIHGTGLRNRNFRTAISPASNHMPWHMVHRSTSVPSYSTGSMSALHFGQRMAPDQKIPASLPPTPTVYRGPARVVPPDPEPRCPASPA